MRTKDKAVSGCGVLTKGTDPKDDLLPCGTRLRFGTDKKTYTEKILLCDRCKPKEETNG